MATITDHFGKLAYEEAGRDAPYDGVDIAGDVLTDKCDMVELQSVYSEAKADPKAFVSRLLLRLHFAIEEEEKKRIENGQCPACDGELRRDVHHEWHEAHGWRSLHKYQGQAYCQGCGWEEG